MTNDNDPRDDAMREIEAALDAHEDRVGTWATSDRCFPRKGRAKLLALIRSKLPQPDAEHEREVAAGELLRAAAEAWPWVYGHPKQSDELWQAIAKAERAGIKP